MSAMNEAYDAGFAAAARLAMRMDLCSDMDSPAYRATRERAVSRLGADDTLRADAERWQFLLRNRLLSIDGRIIAGIDRDASIELVEKVVARAIQAEGLGEGVK